MANQPQPQPQPQSQPTQLLHVPDLTGVPVNIQRELEELRSIVYALRTQSNDLDKRVAKLEHP